MRLFQSSTRRVTIVVCALVFVFFSSAGSLANTRPDSSNAPDKKVGSTVLPARTGQTTTAAQVVTIHDGGFSPATLSVFGPTDLVWENRSGVTVTVRSGLPSNPGTQLYLPTIRNGDGSRARTISRSRSETVDFMVVLGPQEVFAQRFSAPGTYHYHLAEPLASPRASLVGELTLTGTGLLSTSPVDGEDGVAVTRETILTFSAPLDPSTATKEVFAAVSASKTLDYRLHLSQDRQQVTLFYTNPLPGNARVTIDIDGATLRDASGGAVDVDGDNLPGGSGRLDFSTLSLSTVAGTSVCGRVFASRLAESGGTSVNEPLQGATITVDGREAELRAVTDVAGNFCLDPAPAGRFFVHIDGRTAGNATPEGGFYPFVGKAWESQPGIQSSVGDVHLPLVLPGTLKPVSQSEDVTINFPSAVVDEHPEFADVAITVPAGSLFYDDGSPGQQVGIAPVPPDRLPGQLPPGLDFPIVITVQTDGATNFDVPAPICFPNLPDPDTGAKAAPGEKSALWSFDHDRGRFGVVGPMTVNAEGTLICTDPGVGVPAPGWHAPNPGVPMRRGPTSRGPRPDFPPPPPPEEEEECEPGERTCEEKEGHVPSTNGCGPAWLPESVPIWDDPMQLQVSSCDFKPACDGHDFGYDSCGARKSTVDTAFRNDLYAACGGCYPGSDPLSLARYGQCLVYAEAFYQTVNTIGDKFYEDAQAKACECEECPSAALQLPFEPWRPEGAVDAAASDVTLLNDDELLTGLLYYAVVNLETNEIQRGEGGSNGIAFERDLILAPRSRYRVFLLHAETLHEDFMDIVTPSSGEILELPPFYMPTALGYDLDEDGLGAQGEFIMGTDPFDPDSDDDGVLDGAEVQSGDNPASNVIVQTGIIAAADTPGDATDVCVQEDLAAVADGAAGVALFNVFSGMNPRIVAQIDTPGTAHAVACDGQRLAVADGDAGLAVINVADPVSAAIVHQVSFDGASVYAVTATNGRAYAGLSDGRMVSVDLGTGTAGPSVQLWPTSEEGAEVHDLILLGDFLYAIGEFDIVSLYLPELLVVAESENTTSFGDLFPLRRLAAGAGLLFATQDQSVDIFDIAMPLDLRFQNELNPAVFGWRHTVLAGLNRAVAASAPAPDSPADQHRISVYDIAEIGEPRFVTEYETPGLPTSIAIERGLAYVADGDAGLQVLNYRVTDSDGMTPTIGLESNFGPGRFQPGEEMRLTADARDDIQIRDVAFYLNEELIQTDGSFPFEIRFTPPTSPTIVIWAQATDTGGNVTSSEVQTRTAVPEAVRPELIAISPEPDGRIDRADLLVEATFSEAMDGATMTAATFQLLDSTGTPVPGGSVAYDPGARKAQLTFGSPPSAGFYRAALSSEVKDVAGNPLPERSWPIEVTETLSGSFIAPDDDPGSSFGLSMDMDGDLLVVGASLTAVGGNDEQGAVYLFRRDPARADGWRQVKKIVSSDGAAGDQFGSAVAIAGETLVVGAPAKELSHRSMGQVYVFARDEGGADNWGEVTRFADAVGTSRRFGSRLDIVGNTFVVVPTTVLKRAYVYRRSQANASDWTLIKEVVLDENVQHFQAGAAVALSDDESTLVVGVARAHLDENNLNEGQVRIFTENSGGANNWGLVTQLQASDASEDAYFGGSLDLDGDILVVGAQFVDTSRELNATGQFYIFLRDQAAPQGWREVAVISEPETLSRVRTLGSQVAVIGDLVLAVGESDVYLYRPVGGNREQWQRVERWRANNEPAAEFFNGIITTNGSIVVTGAGLAGSGQNVVFLLPVD